MILLQHLEDQSTRNLTFKIKIINEKGLEMGELLTTMITQDLVHMTLSMTAVDQNLGNFCNSMKRFRRRFDYDHNDYPGPGTYDLEHDNRGQRFGYCM